MKTIIIINSAMNILFAVIWLYRRVFVRLSIETLRTPWQKKHYGWALYKWKYPTHEEDINFGEQLFELRWRRAPEDETKNP